MLCGHGGHARADAHQCCHLRRCATHWVPHRGQLRHHWVQLCHACGCHVGPVLVNLARPGGRHGDGSWGVEVVLLATLQDTLRCPRSPHRCAVNHSSVRLVDDGADIQRLPSEQCDAHQWAANWFHQLDSVRRWFLGYGCVAGGFGWWERGRSSAPHLGLVGAMQTAAQCAQQTHTVGHRSRQPRHSVPRVFAGPDAVHGDPRQRANHCRHVGHYRRAGHGSPRLLAYLPHGRHPRRECGVAVGHSTDGQDPVLQLALALSHYHRLPCSRIAHSDFHLGVSSSSGCSKLKLTVDRSCHGDSVWPGSLFRCHVCHCSRPVLRC
mmetsp:Transcript_6091/g.13887  ORF Transcript_6091/g.13887 Transcript_6091/m.13887 type:complete len:322 (-) Transcript_6091:2234-3199(-)